MSRMTAELIVTGSNRGALGAIQGTGAAMATFADGTIGHFKRLAGHVLNFQNLLAGGIIGAGIKKLTDAGDQIDKLSQRLGISTREFQTQAMAMQLGGASAGELESAYRRMTRVILDGANGSTTSQRAIAALGLSIDDLVGLKPAEQFNLLSGALARVEDQSTRSALAQELFGRGGTALLPMLNQFKGGLDELAASMEKSGQLLSEDQVKAAAAFKDAMTGIGAAIQAAGFDILEDVIKDATKAIDELVKSGKLKEWGANAKEVIGELYSVLKGLLGFIGENRELLATLGITYMAVKTAYAAQAGLVALTASMNAAAVGTAGLQAKMTALAGSTGLGLVVIAAAAVALKIRSISKEIEDLDKQQAKMLASRKGQINNRLAMQMQAARIGYQREHGSLEGFDEYWAAIREEAQRRIVEQVDGMKHDAEKAAEDAGPAAIGLALHLDEDDNQSDAALIDDAAEKKRLAELERLRSQAIQLEQDMAAASSMSAAQADRDAHIAIMERELEMRERLAAAAHDEAAAAKDAANVKIDAAQAAWAAVVAGDIPTAADQRQADRAAKDQARAEQRAEDRLAQARERQERGLTLTRRQQALVEADEQRKGAADAAWLAGQAQRDAENAAMAVDAARDAREQQVANYLQQDQAAELQRQTAELHAIREAIVALERGNEDYAVADLVSAARILADQAEQSARREYASPGLEAPAGMANSQGIEKMLNAIALNTGVTAAKIREALGLA